MVGGVAGGSKTVGDIVTAPVPYTDLSASKSRPVVVVANVQMGDWVVCPITGSRQRRPEDIEIHSEDVESGELRRSSWVRVNRLYTLNQSLFNQVVGRLTDAKIAEITAAVRSLF